MALHALAGRRLIAVAALMALALSPGCGSGVLPEVTSLPSISLPARPSALPSLSRPTATATETATATATETTTATATVTVSPSSEAPAETTPAASPSAEVSPEPAPTEADDGGLWWLLLLLAVGAGLAVGAMLWSRSRAAAKEIERRFGLVRSELTWADGELLPRVLASPSAAEAADLWQAGRPRLLVVEEELRQLAVVKSSEERQATASQWRTALATLVTAVDAETSLSPSADSDRLRSARARVEEARHSLMVLLDERRPTVA